ncbi:Uncharacterised protein [Xylophilus ampelinus]|nr:hypothetical protein [Variovorax sp.]VTY37598.1 Uncharacterised protein [Xylophilus ampelinus]|tara:strand:+ start:302 stop:526 length:225 start_codon:yes stop_codon:yes gene_type:complete
MRTLGLIGLVLALVIVGFTMKKQLATVAPAPAVAPAAGDGSAPNERAQSQQIQQQIKQQLDATMSQPRPMPDDN